MIHQVVGVVFADNNEVYILNTLTFILILIVTLNAEKVNFSHYFDSVTDIIFSFSFSFASFLYFLYFS